MASKKQAKKSSKKTTKRGGGSAKSAKRSKTTQPAKTASTRSASSRKKNTSAEKATTASKSKSGAKKAAKSTKSVAAPSGGKKATTKKPPESSAKSKASKSTAVSSPAAKKPSRKKPAAGARKTSGRKAASTRPAGAAEASAAAAATGLRQLSQAVTPGSKAKLSLGATSQEMHTRAADTGAGASLAPTDTKKRRKRKMSKREMDKYRQLLLAKRAELLGDVANMRGDHFGEKGSGNLSHTPQHMADQGTDNYDQEFTLGLVEFERRLLREIDDALQRIEDGTYGICQLTEEPISAARLQAKPWAKYCIAAARQLEQAGRR